LKAVLAPPLIYLEKLSAGAPFFTTLPLLNSLKFGDFDLDLLLAALIPLLPFELSV